MPPLEASKASETAQRLDLWLWYARFFKSRSEAARFAQSGHIRLMRHGTIIRVEKASQTIRPKDIVIFALGARLIDLEIKAIGHRRGPAPEAQALYALRSPPS